MTARSPARFPSRPLRPTLSANRDISTIQVVGGALYFAARDATRGWLLYRSDGTPAGTAAIGVFPGNVRPSNLSDFGGTLLLAADDGVTLNELWRSDGTASGTQLLKNIALELRPAHPDWLTSSGGKLFFTSSDNSGKPRELWVSDGTTTGTVLLKTGAAANLFDFNGTLYFAFNDPATGNELWKSDGTVAGTVLVKDCVPGPNPSNPQPLGVTNGRLVFGIPIVGSNNATALQLWVTDGTPGGTAQLPTRAHRWTCSPTPA